MARTLGGGGSSSSGGAVAALLAQSPAERLRAVAEAWKDARVVEHRWLQQGKWLRFGQAVYRVGDREYPPWEFVERSGRTTATAADAVDIIAMVYSKAWPVPRLATVVNFRPAVGGPVLELPAGLVDPGESPVEAAERELREEVGLVGTPAPAPLPFVYDPGITNESGAMVRMRVDLDGGAAHPGAAPEATELVLPILLPMEHLAAQLQAYHRDFGVALDSRLLAFAHGWDMARALAGLADAAAPFGLP